MKKYLVALAMILVSACGGGNGDVAQRITVAGAGMDPTLTNSTEVDVLRYKSAVATGDIIVFYAPLNLTRKFVKRVIAGPGQAVSIDRSADKVTVDGRVIAEPYIEGVTACGTGTSCTFDVPDSGSTASIPDPNGSPRARLVDPAEETKACERTACYVVMGDNRQNSSDSRQGWLVPVDNIVGYIAQP